MNLQWNWIPFDKENLQRGGGHTTLHSGLVPNTVSTNVVAMPDWRSPKGGYHCHDIAIAFALLTINNSYRIWELWLRKPFFTRLDLDWLQQQQKLHALKCVVHKSCMVMGWLKTLSFIGSLLPSLGPLSFLGLFLLITLIEMYLQLVLHTKNLVLRYHLSSCMQAFLRTALSAFT